MIKAVVSLDLTYFDSEREEPEVEVFGEDYEDLKSNILEFLNYLKPLTLNTKEGEINIIANCYDLGMVFYEVNGLFKVEEDLTTKITWRETYEKRLQDVLDNIEELRWEGYSSKDEEYQILLSLANLYNSYLENNKDLEDSRKFNP